MGRLVQDILATRADGRIKLFLIYRRTKQKKPIESSSVPALIFPWRRRENSGIRYSPLPGGISGNGALVIAPPFLSTWFPEGDFPLGSQVWQDTEVIMPDGAPAAWRNVITSEVLAAGQALPVGDVLITFQWRCSWATGDGGVYANHLSGTPRRFFPSAGPLPSHCISTYQIISMNLWG